MLTKNCPICGMSAVLFRKVVGNVSFPNDRRVYHLYRCETCEHIFRTNWLDKNIYTKDYYAYNSAQTLLSKFITPIFRVSYLPIINFVWYIIQNYSRFQNTPFQRNGSVLDVGGGDGFVLDIYKTLGNKTYNIEISDEIIEINRKKGHKAYKRSLDIKNIKFDLIRINQVIEHVSDPASFVKSLHHLLKPGGKMVVGIPNIRSLSSAILRDSFDQLSLPDHIHFFSEKSIKIVFSKYKKLKISYPLHKYGLLSNLVNKIRNKYTLFSFILLDILIIFISFPLNVLCSIIKKSHFIDIEARP